MNARFLFKSAFLKLAFPLVILALAALAAPERGSAQVPHGSIVENATDSPRATVPDAVVPIVQVETKRARQTTTNEAGGYTFATIPSGTYTLKVSKEGFSPFTENQVPVTINSVTRVDVTLKIGSVSQAVEVTAETALLQTDRAEVRAELTGMELRELPVPVRNYQSMFRMIPGFPVPTNEHSVPSNPSRALRYNVNGTSASSNNVRIDGASSYNIWLPHITAYVPPMEAIETVNVVTNSFDAEQGMAGGASVNVQIKSGTNMLKGSAFEYVQSDKLRARNFFLPAGQKKTHENKHIYGGTVGGPLKHDKLFYFLSVESTHNNTVGGPYVTQASGSATQFLSLPPAALRAGNFAGTGTVIYDPTTGNANGTARLPFAFQNCPGVTSTTDARFDACNFIPANRLNAIAKNIMSYLPQPTLPGNVNNYFSNPDFITIFTKVDSKLTLNVNPSLNINGRVSVLPATDNAAGLYPIVGNQERNPLALGTKLDSNVSSASLSATKVLSQNFVLDGLFGFTRQHTFQLPGGPAKCWGDVVGIPNACQPPLQRDYALPRIDFITGTWSSYGNGIRTNDNTGSVFDYLDPQWQYVANAGWNKGTHNVKFGADVHRLHMNHYEITAPSFQFTGGATAL